MCLRNFNQGGYYHIGRQMIEDDHLDNTPVVSRRALGNHHVIAHLTQAQLLRLLQEMEVTESEDDARNTGRNVPALGLRERSTICHTPLC